MDPSATEAPAEVEVDYAQELAKTDQGPDVSAPTPEQEPEDVVDILQPKSEPRTWTIGPEGMQREYVQRPLSFIAKMQWFSHVGEVLDKAMGGENALTISNLFSAPQTRGGQINIADLREADTFVHAVGKLLTHAPDFLEKSYCIWLGVPDYERPVAIEMMSASQEEGGLSDEDGFEIIEVFIDQNYEALDSFFREKLALLRKRVAAQQKARESRLSKR